MADQTAATPEEYIAALAEPRRQQVQRLHELIRSTAPDLEPHMQSGMIGYGNYHYRYASGREGDWPIISLASNARYISVYVSASENGEYVAERNADRLPTTSIGKSCIRIRKLDDVDLDVLSDVIAEGVRVSRQLSQ